MEQPCYKCGQPVEEGRVFCPHCVAPQIRVVVAEPPSVPVSVLSGGNTHAATLPASETVPVLAVPMEWSQAVKPAALAAVISSVLMLVGLYPLVALPISGFLSVALYRQGRVGRAIRTATGIRLGSLSASFCFGFLVVMKAFEAIGSPQSRVKVHQQIMEMLDKAAAQQADPGVIAFFKSSEGFTVLMIVSIVLLFVFSLVLGSLGGALGASILGRREKS